MKHVFTAIGALLMSSAVDAHVSHAKGLAHAIEHFWLLVALAPLTLFLPTLVRQLVRGRYRD